MKQLLRKVSNAGNDTYFALPTDLKDDQRKIDVIASTYDIDIGAYEYEDPMPSYRITENDPTINKNNIEKLILYPNPTSSQGGIYLKADPMEVTYIYQFLNNLVVENTADNDGGGIYMFDIYENIYTPTNSEINSNTIAYNTATNGDGGGLYSTYSPTSGLFWFNNNLIYHNSPNSGNVTYLAIANESYPAFKHCDIETSNSGVNLPGDCFDSVPYFHGSGNYRLHWTSRSASLDQGDANLVRTSIDLDNNNRVLYTNIDLGCYEHNRVNFLIYIDEELIKLLSIKDDSDNEENIDEFSFISYPNPVREQLTILINMDNDAHLIISVFNMNGRLIWNKNEYMAKGSHEVKWNKQNNAEGLYLLRIVYEDKHYGTKFFVE